MTLATARCKGAMPSLSDPHMSIQSGAAACADVGRQSSADRHSFRTSMTNRRK